MLRETERGKEEGVYPTEKKQPDYSNHLLIANANTVHRISALSRKCLLSCRPNPHVQIYRCKHLKQLTSIYPRSRLTQVICNI